METNKKTILAVPSDTDDGLEGRRSDHFGHCPYFTLVEINGDQVGAVRVMANIAHGQGGCMKPVGLLAEEGVGALVSGGMGRGPFLRMQENGISVYYADLVQCPDVKSAVGAFVDGRLPRFEMGQLCTGSGNCHH